MTTDSTNPPTEAAPAKRKSRRVLMLALPLALILAGGGYWLTGGRYEETDNAYLHQARLTVASDLSGRVISVDVSDNAMVKAGDVLFRLDPEPLQLAVNQADAALSAARLSVAQLKAAYDAAVAQQTLARNDIAYYDSELTRQQSLTDRGVSPTSDLDDAVHALALAKEQGLKSDVGVQGALAALGGDASTPVDDHPAVQAANAARDKAVYNLGLATVRAPADGIVSQAASFQAGQYVTGGSALFVLMASGSTWIEANVKETQLEGIAAGQSAEVEFDAYPGQVFAARVEAIGAGTGSEFSLLPAQNATGNWIKVTQRVPLRLSLLDSSGMEDRLRSGMSAVVTIDTGRERKLDHLLGMVGFGPATAAEVKAP